MSARGCIGLVVGLALFLVSSVAGANLCKEKHIKGRHRTEANVLKSETFAAGSYAGGTDYNARVIGCNRHRDSLGNDVENSIDANFAFAANLPARLIRGKINYMDAFPVRYGYELERKSSTWIVTVPLEFHFPSSNHKDKLDIPLELANALGLSAKGKMCHVSQVKKDGNDVDEGRIVDGDNSKWDSCRVPRNLKVNNVAITSLFMNFWRDTIESYWSRPGFTLEVIVVNLDKLSPIKKSAYDKNRISWQVRLNHNTNNRPTYKAVAFKPVPIYAGIDSTTIVHEFGHTIGLDDEYPEDKNPPSWRKCSELGGSEYCMCVQGTSKTRAKGVYAWIVTHRYAAGSVCKVHSECLASEYCDTGVVVGIGRNQCTPRRADGAGCTKAAQCASGTCNVRCYTPNSKSMGQSCNISAECRNSKCSGTGWGAVPGKCVCDDNSDCGAGKYCNKGVAGIGTNTCKSKLSDGKACTKAHQCASGSCNVRCYTPKSKNMGQSCNLSAECKQGKCSGTGWGAVPGKCVCADNGDCGSGSYCNKGVVGIGTNVCKAKLSDGKACTKKHQCKSGCCKIHNFKMQCRPSNKCK